MNPFRPRIQTLTGVLLFALACDGVDTAQTSSTTPATPNIAPHRGALESADADGGADATEYSTAVTAPQTSTTHAAPSSAAPVFVQQPIVVQHDSDNFLQGLFWGQMLSGGSAHTHEIVHHAPAAASPALLRETTSTRPARETTIEQPRAITPTQRTIVTPTRVQILYSTPAATTRAVSVTTRSSASPMPTTRRFTVTTRSRGRR